MTKKGVFILVAIVILFGVIIISFLKNEATSPYYLAILNSGDSIQKVDLTIITSPTFPDKRTITISDLAILDSLNVSFRQQSQPYNGNIAKLNSVFAIMTIYKSREKVELDIFNSSFTGWVMRVGTIKLRNEYVFNLVKKYLKLQ